MLWAKSHFIFSPSQKILVCHRRAYFKRAIFRETKKRRENVSRRTNMSFDSPHSPPEPYHEYCSSSPNNNKAAMTMRTAALARHTRNNNDDENRRWNYYTHDYFPSAHHDERNFENWDHSIDEEEDEMDEEGEEERRRGRRGFANPRYSYQEELSKQRLQQEYLRKMQAHRFEGARVYSEFNAEEVVDTNAEAKREAREAFRDLSDEYGENKKGTVAVLSKKKRVIPIDVRAVIEAKGKPVAKYILDCDIPGVGVENISFKTIQCVDRGGIAFSIEVVARRDVKDDEGKVQGESKEEEVKEKENVVQKMFRMQKKKKNKKDPNVEEQRDDDVFPKVELYRRERGTHRKYVQRRMYIPERYWLSSARYKDGVATFEFTLCEEGQQITHRRTFEDN